MTTTEVSTQEKAVQFCSKIPVALRIIRDGITEVAHLCLIDRYPHYP